MPQDMHARKQKSVVRGSKVGESLNSVSTFVLPENGIGERIKERREELRLNYEELARMTTLYDAPDYKQGLTAAMLARYEKGVDAKPVLPGARELRLLCSALNVGADWLLLGIDHKDQARYAMDVAQALERLSDALGRYKLAGKPGTIVGASEHEMKLSQVRRPKGGKGPEG